MYTLEKINCYATINHLGSKYICEAEMHWEWLKMLKAIRANWKRKRKMKAFVHYLEEGGRERNHQKKTGLRKKAEPQPKQNLFLLTCKMMSLNIPLLVGRGWNWKHMTIISHVEKDTWVLQWWILCQEGKTVCKGKQSFYVKKRRRKRYDKILVVTMKRE